MAQENHNTDWPAARDPLHRELDEALAKYAAVEPRTGLEGRILASLQAQRDHVLTRSWWRWSFVAAALVLGAILLAVGLAWRSGKAQAPVIAHDSTGGSPPVAQAGQGTAPDGAGLNGEEKSGSGNNGFEKNDRAQSFGPAERHSVKRARPVTVANAHPKLDQFPSPQPLSEQEKILASYIETDPDRAVLLARARTEELRRDQLEETRAFSSREWETDSEDTNNQTTNR